MATKTRGRPKKEKQQYIDPDLDETIPEVEQAAEEYVAVRDKRMNLTEDEVELRGNLMEAMKKHKLDTYKFNGYLVVIQHGDDKVKVKKTEVEGNTDPD